MMSFNIKPSIQTAMALLVFGALLGAEAAPQKCTREDAIKAETSASTLKTWQDVYSSYRRYKQCDDGAISEGYSASVADLLATHWDRVGELAKLSNAHPDFERFVLRHIDETMTMDQGNAIKDNAGRKCPAGARHTCDSIRARFVELGSK